MKGKTHSTEEIIYILRQADGGETAQAICREHNISEQTFYRWKKKYGDMELADAKRLKALEKENAELKKSMSMTKRYDHANEERYGGAIEALDEAVKTSKAESLAATRWKQTD